ncbi:MAG TPA: sigma factor-like helix-turn-helix DNA-binding protein [Allosphingosinicella sp.]|nr:sigma factor-like helix-turn-helix DNA-binding protein [Allosphingosinicella sp.]
MNRSVDDLSETQKDSLRLVYRGYNAKEIARMHGVHPATVHQRLTAARRTLGVARSMEAARMLAEAEGTPIYDALLYDEITVAPTPPDRPSSWLSRLPWPLPTRRRPSNDLSFLELLVAILGLATAFMIAAALYVMAINLLDTIV